MKKLVVLFIIIILFLSITPSILASKSKKQQNNHALCSAGTCSMIGGGGDYMCDPINVGKENNPCCSRSYCSGLTCVKVPFDRTDKIPNSGFTCPEQYQCQYHGLL